MSKVRIYGDTSGYVDIAVPAVAGTTTLNLDKIPQADISGNIAMDTDTLFVDSSNNRVGIGTTSPSGKLHVITTDTSDTLTLESTNADATVGPVLNLFRNSASPADNDLLGRILFKADDSAGNESTFARIEVVATDVTNGSEDARMEFYTAVNDAFTPTLNLVGGEVGIGTTSPGATLDLRGHMRLDSGGSTSRSIYFRNQDTSATGGGQIQSDQHLSLWAGNGGGTPTQYLTITPGGNDGIVYSDPRHPLHIAFSETGSIPTDHNIGASTVNNNYIGFHNNSNSATYSGIALETRTSGASRWLIANEWKNTYLGDLVFRTRDGGTSGSEIVRFSNCLLYTSPSPRD